MAEKRYDYRLKSISGQQAFLLVAVCATLGLGACRSEFHFCRGAYYSCSNLDYDGHPCNYFEGCQPVPGCSTPGDLCLSHANQLQQNCEAEMFCRWSGTDCGDVCDYISDETQCRQTTRCLWSSCTGVAKQCEEYSEHDCPLNKGCYIEFVDNI
jgi:hypothetical protein